VSHPKAAEYNARWRAKNIEQRKVKDLASTLKWNAANPERRRLFHRASRQVQLAIMRGDLVRPDICSQCGQRRKIDAAHADYSRPLDVTWLCRPCHVKWDLASPKTLIV